MLCFLPDGLEMVCLLFVTIAAEILPKRIGKTGMEKGIQRNTCWMPLLFDETVWLCAFISR